MHILIWHRVQGPNFLLHLLIHPLQSNQSPLQSNPAFGPYPVSKVMTVAIFQERLDSQPVSYGWIHGGRDRARQPPGTKTTNFTALLPVMVTEHGGS